MDVNQKNKNGRQLEACIHIGILDFTQLKSRGFHHLMMLTEQKTGEIYSSKFLFHVIELSKLNEADDKEKQAELYRWAKLIAVDRWEDVCMEAKGNPYRELVKDELDQIRQDETERWLYLREEMALMDERCRLDTAKRQGLEEGREKGLAAGLERMQLLNQKLLQDNRIEDLKKASIDDTYLKKLMEEYNIR
ncbi:MAG: PD-(D/E)XK nuclease family transposase [Lachnospiraceae bacterium]|nr:PD-(D/E)XK nuclease family transposase [Lachnospiraceae bacterium]